MNAQPDLFAEPTPTTIVVTGADLGPTADRVRSLGGVILGISAKGATYTLTALLPADGAAAEQAMDATPPC